VTQLQRQVNQAGKFLYEQLQIIDPEVTRAIYAEKWGYEGRYHSVKTGLKFGHIDINSVSTDYVGRAVTWGGVSRDVPTVDFGIANNSVKTLTGIVAYEWNFEQLQQQEVANASGMNFGVDVVREGRYALDQALRDWSHTHTLFGEKEKQFTGMFNHPDVEVKVITDNLYNLTPQQFYDFFLQESIDFQDETKLTADFTNVIGNIRLRAAGLKRFTDISGGGTPLSLMLNNAEAPAFRAWDSVNELKDSYLNEYGITAPSAEQDMFIMYEGNPVDPGIDKYTTDIQVTPAKLKDDCLTYRIVGMIKQSEVRIKRPMRVRYYYYPKYV
jgi:hypothetical protein